jgi:two-component system sensor histidine kinase RegB
VIARELERAAQSPGHAALASGLAEDAKLLRTEVERCRAILDRMRARAAHEVAEAEVPIAAGELAAALREGLDGPERARVRIAVDLPSGLSVGARVDFCEVVGPILRNALDASGTDGAVDVAIGRESDRLVTRVRDRGPGMDEATLRHVGEPFFTTRAPGRGTGLGLFVVHLHLERLGGTLQFESTPGEGTTAIVAWPIAAENARAMAQAADEKVRDVA